MDVAISSPRSSSPLRRVSSKQSDVGTPRESLRQRRNFRECVDVQNLEETAPGGGHHLGSISTPVRAGDKPRNDAVAIAHLLLYLALAALVSYVATWNPRSVPADAPPELFSEGRALQHVEALAGQTGNRQVSTPGVEAAAEYIHGKMVDLVKLAAALDADVIVDIDTQIVSGAVNMVFLQEEITNVYHNLTNLIVRITPKGAEGAPAVMLASHFDSTIGSVGASDAASMIGIMLEIGRLVIESSDSAPYSPLILLMNGGEETLSQAAHGFMQQHQWAREVGAFINLESGGTQGLDMMFQSTGDWTSRAYARAAVYPRGNVMAQDAFLSGVIPADTDFRMFSAQHYGSLPGIDVAFLMGAHQYHTYQDNMENLTPGSLQVMGINTVAAMREFSWILRFDPEHADRSDNSRRGQVFFDVLSTVMITYSADTAALLHKLPLAGLLLATVVMRWASVRQLVAEAALCAAGFLGAALGSALSGLIRVLITGRPLAWFGHWWLVMLLHIPMALAGALAPRLLLGWLKTFTGASAPQPPPSTAAAAQQARAGACLVAAFAAAASSHYEIGSGYIFALWAAALCAVCFVSHFNEDNAWDQQLLIDLAGLLPPALLSTQICSVWLIHIWQKISMAGSLDSPAGIIVSDYAAGLLTGACVWLSTLGTLPAVSVHRKTAARAVACCLACTLAATVLSLAFHPYSVSCPKRVFVQHYHEHDRLGRVDRSVWTLAAMDSVPVQSVLTHPSFRELSVVPEPGSGREWLGFYPLGKIVQTIVLPAPQPEDKHIPRSAYPQLRKRSLQRLGDGGNWRLDIQVILPMPAWGAVNISAPLRSWSFHEDVGLKPGEAVNSRIVRFAGNKGSESWHFWLEVAPEASHVHIQLATMFLQPTTTLQGFLNKLPPHVSPIPTTTMASDWTFKLSGGA